MVHVLNGELGDFEIRCCLTVGWYASGVIPATDWFQCPRIYLFRRLRTFPDHGNILSPSCMAENEKKQKKKNNDNDNKFYNSMFDI